MARLRGDGLTRARPAVPIEERGGDSGFAARGDTTIGGGARAAESRGIGVAYRRVGLPGRA